MDRQYATELAAAGATPVYEYVIVFDGKRTWVKLREIEKRPNEPWRKPEIDVPGPNLPTPDNPEGRDVTGVPVGPNKPIQ